MHYTSQSYQKIWAGLHTVKTVVEIETISQGSTVYTELEDDSIYSVKTTASLFADGVPSIGNFVSRELDLEIIPPENVTIPRMARIRLFVYLTDGTNNSERIPKGVFWIDTRSYNASKSKLTIHGYDAALKFDALYDSTLEWPASASQILLEIRRITDVPLDASVVEILNKYRFSKIPLQPNLTMREMVKGIAARYGTNAIIDDQGRLKLIEFYSDAETYDVSFLVDSHGNRIKFGGDRLIV